MTQPDESQPDGAISGTGLAAFANKSQADWEAEQRNSMSSAWAGAEVGFQKIVGEIPVIGDIVEILTGKEDGNLEDLGTWVNGITSGLRRALNDIGTIIAGIGGTIARDVGNFVNKVWTGLTDTWNDFWGGVFGTTRTTGKTPADVRTAASAVSTTANTAQVTASTAASGVTDTSRAIYNGYYGGGAAGTVAQVQETVAAIKTKLESGYTLETLTTTGTWTRPWTPGGVDEPTEFWALCFGSGGGGGAGQYATSGTVAGGLGGEAGSYAAIQIDPADIGETVSYTVATGALGATTNGGARTSGSQTSFGSFITTLSGRAFISSLFGYYDADDSSPGAGGTGGKANTTATAATAGGSTPLASGGAAGANAANPTVFDVSTAGGTGSTASLELTTRAGGGGGGGGGGGWTGGTAPLQFSHTASNGGNGGFPGGGAGGGGAMFNSRNLGSPYTVAGNGGNGAHGVIILLWK